ncbi:MAG: M48 family metallopeptidase [Flavobacteriales bacterium]|nr:M48 family metallopeptidase [Flavobacteriales bacterium]
MTPRAYPATFYDGKTSKPHEALVALPGHNVLEVRVGPERFMWPLEEKGMGWERNNELVRITFGDHPRRVVISRDKDFIKAFVSGMGRSGRRGAYDRALSVARVALVLFLFAVVGLLVFGYFYAIPWGAERMALLLPKTLDEKLGKTVMGSMALGMDEDSACSALLQRFGDRLDLGHEFDLQFHVVESDQVNAFALPGGQIVVYTGILDLMDGPDQLAALLAHEATHVEERHSTRMLVRQIAGYLFISLLLGDVNGVAAIVAEHGDDIRSMSFSRELESDADLQGMRALHAAGQDPHGMVRLLGLLDEASADVPQAFEFLSSHPMTTDRITAAEELAEVLGADGTRNGPDPAMAALFQAIRNEQGVDR